MASTQMKVVPYNPALAVRTKLSEKDWLPYKSEILELRRSKLPLSDIRSHIAIKYGFQASESQYKARLKIWGSKLRFSRDERRFIVQNIAARGSNPKRLPKMLSTSDWEYIEEKRILSVWNRRTREPTMPMDLDTNSIRLIVGSPSPSPSPSGSSGPHARELAGDPCEDNPDRLEVVMSGASELCVSDTWKYDSHATFTINTEENMTEHQIRELIYSVFEFLGIDQSFQYQQADNFQTLELVDGDRHSQGLLCGGREHQAADELTIGSNDSTSDLVSKEEPPYLAVSRSLMRRSGSADAVESIETYLLRKPYERNRDQSYPYLELIRYTRSAAMHNAWPFTLPNVETPLHDDLLLLLKISQYLVTAAFELQHIGSLKESLACINGAHDLVTQRLSSTHTRTRRIRLIKGMICLRKGDVNEAIKILFKLSGKRSSFLRPRYEKIRHGSDRFRLNFARDEKVQWWRASRNFMALYENKHVGGNTEDMKLLLSDLLKQDMGRNELSIVQMYLELLSEAGVIDNTEWALANHNYAIALFTQGSPFQALVHLQDVQESLGRPIRIFANGDGAHRSVTVQWAIAICILISATFSPQVSLKDLDQLLREMVTVQKRKAWESVTLLLVEMTANSHTKAWLQNSSAEPWSRSHFERGLKYRQWCLEGNTLLYGPDHECTLFTLQRITKMLSDRGLILYARPISHYLLRGYEKTLGPLDDRVTNAIVMAADLSFRCGMEIYEM